MGGWFLAGERTWVLGPPVGSLGVIAVPVARESSPSTPVADLQRPRVRQQGRRRACGPSPRGCQEQDRQPIAPMASRGGRNSRRCAHNPRSLSTGTETSPGQRPWGTSVQWNTSSE